MLGLRYAPEFYSAWRAVQDGAVGSVRLVNTRKSYKLGQRPSYYTQRETYGGTIPWVGIHAIDWIQWFSGESFRAVRAQHSAQHNHGFGDLEVSALCQFTMSNEVLASASIDYLRPDSALTHGDDWVRVVGTDGVIEVRQGRVHLINGETAGEEELPVACDRQIFQDFVNDIDGNGPSLLSPQEIFATTKACLLARRSADEDCVILFEGAQ
jgi:predicted dehydrogenase